jgi:hypothetical protein
MHSQGAFTGDVGSVARKNGCRVLISAAKAGDFNMLPGQNVPGRFAASRFC